MKKLICILCLLLTLVGCLAACEEAPPPPSEHTHAFGEWMTKIKPTCGTKGEKVRSCACGESETAEITATGVHHYGTWSVSVAATCVTKGLETRTCECGASEAREIDATGVHVFGEWSVAKEATCTAKGQKTRACQCGETEFAGIAMRAHSFSAWIEINTPTCNEKGKKARSCTCGATENKETPSLGGCVFNTENTCTVCQTALDYTEGLTYVYNSDKTAFLVYGLEFGDESTEIVVPPYHKGLPVVEIEPWAFQPYWANKIVSIQIPASIKRINSNAFDRCEKLERVEFAQGSCLEVIEDEAFIGCSSLFELTLPESVREIGAKAFHNCPKLVEMERDVAYVGNWAVEWIFSDYNVAFDVRAKTIGIANRTFEYIGCIPYLTLPESVKYIGDYAFNGSLIERIVLPSTLEYIGIRGIGEAERLQSITFKDPKGWYVTPTQGAEEKKGIVLSTPTENVRIVCDTYANYYWYKIKK